MAFNTSVTGSSYLESTLDETFLDFGNQRQVTIVAGEYNQGFATNSGDFGVKYEDGESLFRVTVRYDRDLVGNLKTSEGFDTETSINGKLSLLGDVSYVSTNSPVSTDFGIGPEIKINNTDCLFALYSDRDNGSKYRIGYLSDTRLGFFALMANYASGSTPTLTGFFSTSSVRMTLSYNPDNHSLFTANILSFGNKPIDPYVMKGVLKEQIILTDRSVTDSDYTYVFPAWAFLEPKSRVSDVLRANVTYDLQKSNADGGFVDNAVMISLGGHNDLILSQYVVMRNIGTDAGVEPNVNSTYCGMGLGFKINHWKLVPVLNVQSHGLRLDMYLNY